MSVPINSAVPGAWRAASRADQQVRVPLGIVVVTRAVDQQLISREDGRAFVMSCLRRHGQGDWGDLGPHDAEANDLAPVTGARILSSYPIPEQIRRGAGDERLWIITEAEDEHGVRSQTTVLFPSDY